MSEKTSKRARKRVPPARSTGSSTAFYCRRAWQLILTVAAVSSTLAFTLVHRGSSRPALPLGSLGAVGPLASHGDPGAPGSEGVPVPDAPALALAASLSPGQSVDGISCAPLVVASGACFSWLHTHAADGIVHIESPIQRTYTLGEFFDVWHQPLTASRVATAAGRVTAFVNGRPYLGDARTIPLVAHEQIQLEVGRPLVRPESISFPNGL